MTVFSDHIHLETLNHVSLRSCLSQHWGSFQPHLHCIVSVFIILTSKYSDIEVQYFHGVPHILSLVIFYYYFCLNVKFLKTYLQTNILFIVDLVGGFY